MPREMKLVFSLERATRLYFLCVVNVSDGAPNLPRSSIVILSLFTTDVAALLPQEPVDWWKPSAVAVRDAVVSLLKQSDGHFFIRFIGSPTK